MKPILAAAALIALQGCSSQTGIDPNTWSCGSLIQPVIEMSKDKGVEVLEITNPEEKSKTNEEIECSGRAELSNGGWYIDYGAHVSDGGQVIVEYKQRY